MACWLCEHRLPKKIIRRFWGDQWRVAISNAASRYVQVFTGGNLLMEISWWNHLWMFCAIDSLGSRSRKRPPLHHHVYVFKPYQPYSNKIETSPFSSNKPKQRARRLSRCLLFALPSFCYFSGNVYRQVVLTIWSPRWVSERAPFQLPCCVLLSPHHRWRGMSFHLSCFF